MIVTVWLLIGWEIRTSVSHLTAKTVMEVSGVYCIGEKASTGAHHDSYRTLEAGVTTEVLWYFSKHPLSTPNETTHGRLFQRTFSQHQQVCSQSHSKVKQRKAPFCSSPPHWNSRYSNRSRQQVFNTNGLFATLHYIALHRSRTVHVLVLTDMRCQHNLANPTTMTVLHSETIPVPLQPVLLVTGGNMVAT